MRYITSLSIFTTNSGHADRAPINDIYKTLTLVVIVKTVKTDIFIKMLMLEFILESFHTNRYCTKEHMSAKLEKVFLPPGACFLRQNFPNIEEEFS